MAIAYDAASNTTQNSDDFSWTHTPTGTPRGALVLIVQTTTAADQVLGVTYGGTAMIEVAGSPMLVAAGGEDGAIYGYFLGSSVPTGAQTVAVDANGAGAGKRGVCVTVTAAADVEVDDTSTLDSAGVANPSVTLQTTASTTTFIAAALRSGQDATAGTAPGTDYTDILEHDFGLGTASWIRRTSNASGGNITVDWVATSDEAGILAVALREASAAAPNRVRRQSKRR